MDSAATEHRDEQTWCGLRHAPLPVAEVAAFLSAPTVGGISLFLGTTRRWTKWPRSVQQADVKETELLYYEAYEPMALAELEALIEAGQRRWSVERCCLLHRLGEVPAEEVSVVVGVGTAHRAAAFEASRWLIDSLKAQVPIWKREVFADGTEAWVEPKD